MGVAGAGKSTIGAALAQRLGGVFVEGDDYHNEANRQKIASGTPLTDDDRWPWLTALAQRMCVVREQGFLPIASCSALRPAYRDYLRHSTRLSLEFVALLVDETALRQRLDARQGHFATSSILASQLATLELDAAVRQIDAGQAVDAVVAAIVSRLGMLDA